MLFGTLAVLSFAACQNEELVTDDKATAPVLGREQINLTLAPADGTTRMINDNGVFEWEDGEELGACLVDVSTVGTAQDNAHMGNYKFQYSIQNKEFTTASTVSKGVYVFYYPYNEENTTTREGILVKELSARQEWDANGDKMMANNFMVSPVVNLGGYEGNALTLPMTMRSIYNYGLLNIKNSTDDAFEIQKIIIETTNGSESFKLGTKLAPYTISNGTDLLVDLTTGAGTIEEKFKKADALYTTKPGLLKSWIDATYNPESTKSLAIDALTETTGVQVAAGATASTRVLIPAGSYTANDFVIKVYTSAGYQKFTVNDTDITTAVNGTNVQLANGVKTTFNLDVETVSAPSTLDIISENDFIASMKGVGNAVTVQMGSDVELTTAAVEAIPAGTTVTFANDVKFSGDMTLKKMVFNGNVALNGGNIVVENTVTFTSGKNITIDGANVEMKAAGTGNLTTIVKSGTLTVPNGTFTSYIDTEGGEVNIGSAATTQAAAAPAVTTYLREVKKGTVNVNVPLTVDWVNLTLGEASGNAVATLNVNANIAFGTNNSPKINILKTGKVVNKANMEVETNGGTIDNYATLTVATNNATINQKGEDAELTCTANASGATINTEAYTRTTVDSNSGEVIYVENARISSDGTVVYNAPSTIKATDFSSLSPTITKINFANDFTYTYGTDEIAKATLPATVTELEFKGNLTLEQDWALNASTELTFAGSKQNITGTTKSIKEVTDGNTLTMTVGKSGVNTDLYIGAGVTITDLLGAPTVNSGSKVWNDGTVKAGTVSVQPTGWSGQEVQTGA